MSRIVRVAPPPVRVMGVDPSLSSTGYAYKFNGTLYTGRVVTDKLRGPSRLLYARNRLLEVIEAAQPQVIVYEDYTRGRNANNAFDLGELGGVYKTMIHDMGIDLMLVGPTSLKKSIIGRGNADQGPNRRDKPEMRAALYTKFGYQLNQNDEADAFALMVLGELRFGGGVKSLGTIKQLRLDTLNEYEVIKGRPQSFKAALKLVAK